MSSKKLYLFRCWMRKSWRVQRTFPREDLPVMLCIRSQFMGCGSKLLPLKVPIISLGIYLVPDSMDILIWNLPCWCVIESVGVEIIYFTSYPHPCEMVSICMMRTKVFCILLYLLNISIIWVLFSYRVMLLSFSSFVIFYACFIINNIHFIFIRCILFVNLLFVVCLCKDLRVDRMYLLTVWTCYNFSFSRYLPRFWVMLIGM